MKEKFDKWCLECEEKLWNWVHEKPGDREEINKRAYNPDSYEKHISNRKRKYTYYKIG